MTFAVLVVDRHPAVKQLAELGWRKGFSDLDREQGFCLVEKESPVAIGARDECLSSFGFDWKRTAFQCFCPADELLERVMIEASQDQDLAAREKSGVDLEAGVFSRRTDESDGPILDIRKEAVLLCPVEAVDLIHEKKGLLTCPSRSSSVGEDLL